MSFAIYLDHSNGLYSANVRNLQSSMAQDAQTWAKIPLQLLKSIY